MALGSPPPPRPLSGTESLLTLVSQGSQGPSEGLGRFAYGKKVGVREEARLSPLPELAPRHVPPSCSRGSQGLSPLQVQARSLQLVSCPWSSDSLTLASLPSGSLGPADGLQALPPCVDLQFFPLLWDLVSCCW